MSFSFDLFVIFCVELILQGKANEMQTIVDEFNDPNERLEKLKQLLADGPYTLKGMLLAFQLREMRPQPLDFTIWPHNILLEEARSIKEYEHFQELLRAVEETVEWEDTFEAVQELCSELQDYAIRDVYLNSEHFGFAQPLVLACLLKTLAGSDRESVPETKLLVDKALASLERIGEKSTSYKLYFSWAGNGRSKDIYPTTLRTLATLEVMTAIDPVKFPIIYEQLRTESFKLFYQEVEIINKKDTGQFLWVFERMVKLLGSNDAFEQWISIMKDMERNWNE